MEHIITKIHNLIKDTKDLISFEEQVKVLMYETLADLVRETFTHLIKDTKDLNSFEEQVKVLMYETFADLVSETFTHLNKVMKEKAREKKYLVERNDSRTIQFSFGAVTYQRTLFKDVHDNKSIYLL